MGDIGFSELLVILLVAILCFGKELPSVMRKVGRAVNKARRYLLDIKDEVQRQIPMEDFEEIRRDIDVRKDIESGIKESLEDYKPPETSSPPEPGHEPPAPAPSVVEGPAPSVVEGPAPEPVPEIPKPAEPAPQ